MKIAFTRGFIEILTSEYCTVTLFNNDKQVYKVDMNKYDATDLFLKHKNIEFPQFKNLTL